MLLHQGHSGRIVLDEPPKVLPDYVVFDDRIGKYVSEGFHYASLRKDFPDAIDEG